MRGGVALADAVDRQRALQAGAAAVQDVRPGRAALGPARHEVVAHRALVVRGRPLPQELARRGLAHLHLRHASSRARAPAPGSSAAATASVARAGCAWTAAFIRGRPAATSCLTLYFFASARTAAVRCSAAVASVQSWSTTPRRRLEDGRLRRRDRVEPHGAPAVARLQRVPLARLATPRAPWRTPARSSGRGWRAAGP